VGDQVADVELVADLDRQREDAPGQRRGDLHAGLVALDGDQALLGLDRVADLHQQLDDADVFEVADVGYADFNAGHRSIL
jgi:hypothetical protein